MWFAVKLPNNTRSQLAGFLGWRRLCGISTRKIPLLITFLGGEGGDLLDERLHHEFWFAATRASRGGLRQGRAWDSDSYQFKDCLSEGE